MTLNYVSSKPAEFRDAALSVGTLNFQSAITATGIGVALFGANCPAARSAPPPGGFG